MVLVLSRGHEVKRKIGETEVGIVLCGVKEEVLVKTWDHLQ